MNEQTQLNLKVFFPPSDSNFLSAELYQCCAATRAEQEAGLGSANRH